MNLTQLSGKISRELDDLNANFYSSSSDIIPSIQDGYNLTVALTECIESNATVNFQSGLVYYNFTIYISDYLRIFGIYNSNTGRWLEPATLLELQRNRIDWELTDAEPGFFCPIDYKTVALFPVKSSATGSMIVLYKAKANVLNPNDVPQVPEEQVKSLEYYSLDDLLDQAQEFNKATGFANLFDASLEDIKKVLRDRSSPNHFYYKHEG